MDQSRAFVYVAAISAALSICGVAQKLPAPDHQLVASIEKDWISSDALKSHRLKATADQGLVTISGQVANLFEREVAVELARRTSGVITVIDQIEVKVNMRPDAGLEQDVIKALRADPATKELTLTGTAKNGVVTLTGEAATRGQRTLATEIASGVKGVSQIHTVISKVEVTHGKPISAGYHGPFYYMPK